MDQELRYLERLAQGGDPVAAYELRNRQIKAGYPIIPLVGDIWIARESTSPWSKLPWKGIVSQQNHLGTWLLPIKNQRVTFFKKLDGPQLIMGLYLTEGDLTDGGSELIRPVSPYEELKDVINQYPVFTDPDELWNQGSAPRPNPSKQTILERWVRKLEAKYGIRLWMYYSSGGFLVLSKIVVPKEDRNKGLGTAAMEEITRYADAKNLTLALTADSAFGGNKRRLKRFYQRFGFTNNTGRRRDYRINQTMIRRPQAF